MEQVNLYIKDIFPDLAIRMEQVFLNHKRNDLYEQVDNLSIVSICDCGASDCGSFYTITPPNEDVDHFVEGFTITPGLIIAVVYEGKIGYIEILNSEYGEEVRKSLNKYLNRIDKT